MTPNERGELFKIFKKYQKDKPQKPKVHNVNTDYLTML